MAPNQAKTNESRVVWAFADYLGQRVAVEDGPEAERRRELRQAAAEMFDKTKAINRRYLTSDDERRETLFQNWRSSRDDISARGEYFVANLVLYQAIQDAINRCDIVVDDATQGTPDHTLHDILSERVVRIGVKEDYPPFGSREMGNFIGIEIDIAGYLADALGVTLELVSVSASTRNEKLIEGDIDLFIATMSDTPGRRKVVGAIDPNYYAAGINLLARKDVVKSWQDLKAKPVCGIDGAYYNSDISKRYGARVVEFKDLGEAKRALRNGDCVALLYDDALIQWLISLPEWSNFEMPVDSEDVTPWAIAVRLSDHGHFADPRP